MKHYTLLVCMLALLLSCDRPECVSSNPIFKQYKPQEQAYKKELARIIDSTGTDAFDYWIAGYDKTPRGDFLKAYIQNDKTCAVIVLEDKGVARLERVAEKDARGYFGAGLSGLAYEVKRYGDSVGFICTDLNGIID